MVTLWKLILLNRFLYTKTRNNKKYLSVCLGLESLVEPLRATCTMKVKANSVKQEYEKQDELKRSALRAAAALLQIPEAGKVFSPPSRHSIDYQIVHQMTVLYYSIR